MKRLQIPAFRKASADGFASTLREWVAAFEARKHQPRNLLLRIELGPVFLQGIVDLGHEWRRVFAKAVELMGLDAETGVFMLLFVDLSHGEYKKNGFVHDEGGLVEAIIHGAVKRIRPKAMTVCAALLGLLPIMWSSAPART